MLADIAAALVPDRGERLALFLRRLARTPFEFGWWDCGVTIANWSLEAGGKDPAAAIRGTYCDEAGWRALADRSGGLPLLIDRCCGGAGLARVGDLAPGDIGPIVIERLNMTAGGIFLGGAAWCVKIGRGFTQVRGAPLSAWRP